MLRFVFVAVFEGLLLVQLALAFVFVFVLESLGLVLVILCVSRIAPAASQRHLRLSAGFLPMSSRHHDSFPSRSYRWCRRRCFSGRPPRSGSFSGQEQGFLSTRKSP